jgi:hypothetical protein
MLHSHIMSYLNESVFRINTDGTVEVVQIAPDQELGDFYVQELACNYFTYVDHCDIPSNGVQTDYMLKLVGDKDAALNASSLNRTVSQVLHQTFFGPALIVCMHAVGEDGEERLADVGLIYRAMGSTLRTPWTEQEIAVYRSRPLRDRALELLGLFDRQSIQQ